MTDLKLDGLADLERELERRIAEPEADDGAIVVPPRFTMRTVRALADVLRHEDLPYVLGWR